MFACAHAVGRGCDFLFVFFSFTSAGTFLSAGFHEVSECGWFDFLK